MFENFNKLKLAQICLKVDEKKTWLIEAFVLILKSFFVIVSYIFLLLQFIEHNKKSTLKFFI